MRVAIVGLPRCGKTTLFNAVTRSNAPTGSYAAAAAEPNVGAAKVADPRLDSLAGVFNPARRIPAEVTFVDIPGPPAGAPAAGVIGGVSMNLLQEVGALLIVTRAFEDPSVPAASGGVDPTRDAETMLLELAVADAEIVRRRIGRIDEGMKGAKPAERDALQGERELLERLRAGLDSGAPIHLIPLSPAERARLQGFPLLTAKPAMLVANTGEDDAGEPPELRARLGSLEGFKGAEVAALCCKMEMELAQMDPEDEAEFRESLDMLESASDSITGMCRQAMDVVTFFTGNDRDVRAWPVVRGTTALQAAGAIHSDFERGFIRAEVLTADRLVECGSLAEARNRGSIRQEGRDYVVQDGDVIQVLFSV